jgi:beta-N-acetylhexosaminidase
MMDGIVLRRLDPAGDRAALESLWRAALHPAWPFLPAGLGCVKDGLVAEDGDRVVGAVGLDPRGSLPLLMVDPSHQRRGLGTALHDAALARLRALGTRRVKLGSGGEDYIWPGVPDDLPAAAGFFAARGWQWIEQVTDLVCDLDGYRTPEGVHERARRVGVRFEAAGEAELPEVLDFEAATFPNWLRWYQRRREGVLVARAAAGQVVGALIYEGPDPRQLFAPMLGPLTGTIGCVGVAPATQGKGIGTAMVARASELLRAAGTRACHIGWTLRVPFYARLGYARWRGYLMSSRDLP